MLPHRGHYELKRDPVMARIVGKCPRQGNRRLQLDVLYIGSNVTGTNVLYIKHLTSVSVENVMSVSAYYHKRKAIHEI